MSSPARGSLIRTGRHAGSGPGRRSDGRFERPVRKHALQAVPYTGRWSAMSGITIGYGPARALGADPDRSVAVSERTETDPDSAKPLVACRSGDTFG